MKLKKKLQVLVENYNESSPIRRAYIERVLLSLSKKSTQKNVSDLFNLDLEKLINEWEFIESGDSVRKVNKEQCQLCSHPETVYQYKITNKETKEFIWTGSSCILNFSINVIDEMGKELTSTTLREKFFRDKVLEIKENERISKIHSLIKDLNEGLPHGQQFVMNQQMSEYGTVSLKQFQFIAVMYKRKYKCLISSEWITLFKINFRKTANVSTLQGLEDWQLAQIFPLVNSQVLRKYVSVQNQYKCYKYIEKTKDRILMDKFVRAFNYYPTEMRD